MSEIEVERYELFEPDRYNFELDRRTFMKVAGGGIAVICLLPQIGITQDRRRRRGRRRGNVPQEVSAWIHIDEKGKVSVFTGKAEVGQNIRTSLAQVVAEELQLEPAAIRMVMADTDLTPYDRGTFGSRTTPSMGPQLRRAAATAREILRDLAAEKAGVARESTELSKGTVKAGDKSFIFGELTEGKKFTKTISGDGTAAKDWKVAGKSVGKIDGRAIVTGAHKFAVDIVRPGMMFGKIRRPPSFGATLSSLDDSGARKLGATVVRDGGFVGVVAEGPHLAEKALMALKAEWETREHVAEKELYEHFRKTAQPRESRPSQSVERGLADADIKLEDRYTIPYIAHTPLEPRAGVAEWVDGKLTAWTGSQRPFGVRSELARAFGIGEDKVRVIVPDTGSGYGGKHTGEAAVEAARLSKEVGKPVKVAWTREEEFTWAYFRPAGLIEVRSGVKKDGTLTAWDFHNYNSGRSSISTPYEVQGHAEVFHRTRSPLRQGSYRALAAPFNSFARESHMDDLAAKVEMDPLEFRLKNLRNDRLGGVLKAAAEKFGWGDKAGENRGFGLACTIDKGGYVANCAEVEISGNSIRVVRVVAAFECGAIINPKHLENQVVGCTLMGIGAAMLEAIHFEGGRILNPRLSEYPVPRFSDTPEIECVLLDRKDLPSAGAGETPIAAIAPAIGNAVFAATGRRVRDLPMKL